MIRHLVNTVTLSGALTFASFVLVFTTLMCGGVMLAAWAFYLTWRTISEVHP